MEEKTYQTEDEDYVPDFIPPIRSLFRNVLMRALLDLGSDQEKKRDARVWFSKWKNTLPYGISFRDVCETLEFTADTIEAIKSNPYGLLNCPRRGKKKSA
jgi:hypothetical protein